MRSKLEQYIEDHSGAWAQSTLAMERARLLAIADKVAQGPQAVWDHFRGASRYTLKNVLTRLVHFERWLGEDLGFAKFMLKHRAALRHAYKRREVPLALDKVSVTVSQMPADVRPSAELLLTTGLRISELYKLEQRPEGWTVVGKGGKLRKVYGIKQMPELVTPKRLRTELAKVGLKPHDLRKIAATRLARAGVDAGTLCAIMGWSGIQTAYSYLQRAGEKEIEQIVTKAGQA